LAESRGTRLSRGGVKRLWLSVARITSERGELAFHVLRSTLTLLTFFHLQCDFMLVRELLVFMWKKGVSFTMCVIVFSLSFDSVLTKVHAVTCAF
jgi:hypothetical protein